ncbi:hypothetical protein CMO94_01755 [Candidatus Woesearchaeota archaeon]|nr:hypothetical protein [Candidatus Woesearchaeota archaeon]
MEISSAYEAEKKFLTKSGRQNKCWAFAVANKAEFKFYEQFNDPEIDFSFVLINPASSETGDRKKWDSENINSLLKKIKEKNKKIIIWTHKTDKVYCQDEKNKNLNPFLCIPFSHAGGKTAIEEFLNHVTQGNFEEKFKKLIDESLKKINNPHLTALSILYQGYLTVHGKGELPSNNDISEDSQKLTEEASWWSSALEFGIGKEEIKKSPIYNELKDLCEIERVGDETLTTIKNFFEWDTKNPDDAIFSDMQNLLIKLKLLRTNS